MTGRICEFDDQPHYAKGLCWPHYKKWHRSGYVIGPPKPRGRLRGLCECCGGSRAKSKGGPRGRLCTACKLARTCVICDSGFTAQHSMDTFCSDECRPVDYWRWWAAQNQDKLDSYVTRRNALRRARKANGRTERFWRKTIYKRDNWICGICDKPVDPDLDWPDPQSASLDHIIPLSHDGEHIRANVRLTHLHCNVTRGVGNHDDPIQLTFVG